MLLLVSLKILYKTNIWTVCFIHLSLLPVADGASLRGPVNYRRVKVVHCFLQLSIAYERQTVLNWNEWLTNLFTFLQHGKALEYSRKQCPELRQWQNYPFYALSLQSLRQRKNTIVSLLVSNPCYQSTVSGGKKWLISIVFTCPTPLHCIYLSG